MLSQTAIDFLSPLTYKENAERRICFLPLGGIYWEDEIPDFQELHNLPKHDRNLVYRLFSIRFSIWNGEELSEGDQRYWDEARLQVPKYAMFQRLKLSFEDEQAQDAVEREVLEETGLVVRARRLLLVTSARDRPHLGLIYHCEQIDGSFRPSAEVSDARFYALDALPDGLLGLERGTIEVAIPWETIGLEAPKPGQRIGLGLARLRAQPPAEATQWSPTFGSNHEPEQFGHVVPLPRRFREGAQIPGGSARGKSTLLQARSASARPSRHCHQLGQLGRCAMGTG